MKIFSYISFQRLYGSTFDYLMPEYGFLCIYPAWSSLSFLNLWVDIFYQFKEIFGHYLLKDLFCSILFLILQ